MAAGDTPVRWQREACPSWCVVAHSESDHERDHTHQGNLGEIPVVALRERPDGASAADDWYAARLAVVLQRRDGTGTTALYLGDGHEQRLELDLSSAVRVVRHLGAALASVTDGRPSSAGPSTDPPALLA